MKKILLAAITGGLIVFSNNTRAALDFASLAGSQIQFGPGSQFSVTDSAFSDASLGDGSAQWQVTTPGLAVGLKGAFSGGPWTFGAIAINGPVQTATVTTTTGAFAIDDGAGNLLTGNVDWVQVFTVGAVGGLNAGATINVTGINYAGSNAALLALLSGSGTGSMDLTFQFATPESLTQLANGGKIGTSYSGSLTATTAVPEPATIIAGILLLLPLGMSTMRILRKKHSEL